MESTSGTFRELTPVETAGTTLIEGLPGLGLVASIAVDQITTQLGLQHHGTIYHESFPPVVTFESGLVRDPVRVYAGENPSVLTLQSDLALPPSTFDPLVESVLTDLTEDFERAIFLAGAPAGSNSRRGSVAGVATDPEMRDTLNDVGIDLAQEPGLVGGVTGALVQAFFHANIPAVVLIVEAHPYLPDPGAAQSVIENALEPLVDFDIDTSELEKQAEEIQRRMQQIATQYQQMVEAESVHPQDGAMSGMYQ
ncbi:MAG: proteasome assembly chaperone family protein [Halodesulfurarchaeum sp.]